MNNTSIYKSCFVPLCKSTSIRTPDKKFFNVPTDEKIRRTWFKSARRCDQPGQCKYFCCEDHFDFKEDLDNYTRYCLMGAPIKLKKNAVPHIFKCQPLRVNLSKDLNRPAFKKLNRKREVAELLSDTENQSNNCSPRSNVLSPEEPSYKKNATCTVPNKRQKLECINEINNSIGITLTRTANDSMEISLNEMPEISEIRNLEANNKNLTPSSSHIQSTSVHGDVLSVDTSREKVKILSFGESPSKSNTQRSFGVQVQQKLTKPHFRSKFVMCKPSMCDAYSETTAQVVDRMCSPIKSLPAVRKPNVEDSSKRTFTTSSSSNTEYQPSSSQTEYEPSSTCSDEKEEKNKSMRETALNITKYFISMDAVKYVGIRNEWLWIIDLLHTSTKCTTDAINLTLMKIRTNDSFSRLGDQFGISTSQASRVFNKTVKPLSHYLKTLIFCPNTTSIKKNLPIAFRAYYSRVSSILDAFEIEIEKPSDPVKQALTWSDYKKCNTLKYLIVCTPDGFITFISSGYGGRISDTVLFEESKAIDILPEKSGIMADRGFKQIQTILNRKECELIRPPSVSSTGKSTKEDVIKTKSIASLRIHVERVIRRVREYKILEPHSCLDRNTMPYIDDIVYIVSGLINVQKPLIKQ